MATAASLAMVFGASSAYALTSVGPQELHGTGLGAVNTVLTIQNKGTETGSVGLNSSGSQVITGDAKTGTSQTRVRSLDSLGIDSASDLRIVFNAAEPGNAADNGITLNNLQLSFFSSSGTLLYQTGQFSPVTFDSTTTGTGKSDFVFALTGAEASAAQAAAFSGDFGANVVGLSATATSAAGGNETFFITDANTAPVPEPSTYAMLGLGLLGLGFMRRRKIL